MQDLTLEAEAFGQAPRSRGRVTFITENLRRYFDQLGSGLGLSGPMRRTNDVAPTSIFSYAISVSHYLCVALRQRGCTERRPDVLAP
jgi:hypothetical protein